MNISFLDNQLAVYAVSLFFLAMGLVALVAPSFVTRFFAHDQLSPEMRNEVRAVYGGFGIAIAVILVVAASDPVLRTGVLLTVAVALFGMAGGRLVSFALERPRGIFPMVFLVVELVLGSALILVR